MSRFFMRNDPKTIQDALELSLEDFVLKYKPTTTTEEILSKVYMEINVKHAPKEELKPPLPDRKTVTFKVIKKEKNMQKEQVLDDELSPEELEELRQLEAAELDNEEITPEVKTPVTTEKVKKTRNSDKGKKRDARIAELITEGLKPKDIVELMQSEGFKVHIPQISLVKKAMPV